MAGTASRDIVAGFLPLVDAASLVAAREKGFAAAEGLELTLVRESSWANIRDRVTVGHFQCAHMLAPMPIAARLGLSPIPVQIVAPMALGLGGDAVTVSAALWEDLSAAEPLPDLDAKRAGEALARLIRARREAGRPKLVFAVVHPHSAHNYDLRYWLHASGIDPDRDVEIVIIAPPLLPDALANERIDGFCVGEPWSSVAVATGNGIIVTSKSSIWRSSPEKVLGVEAAFAEREPETVDAMIRAVYRAAAWCADTNNHHELASLLSGDSYIGVPAEHILPALTGQIPLGGSRQAQESDFFLPFDRAATFPWKSHAVWFYSQILRWKQAPRREGDAALAADVYRPDIYRRALAPLGVPFPSADAKIEGALAETRAVSTSEGELFLGPDGFFDGQIFDPDHVEEYLTSQQKSAQDTGSPE